jgi:excisionase family DNA binding protein
MIERRHDGRPADQDYLMLVSEVSVLFGVTAKTVARWSRSGKLHPIRTLGGHRRFWASEVYALLND